MKKLLTLVIATFAFLLLTVNTPALAGDATKGAALFSANCAACHMGGKNVVNPAKTLQKADLEKYGKDNLEAIMSQVKNGMGAMPSFNAKLSSEEIEDVATYVLAQAEKGW